MSETRINQIIQHVLRADEAPPSADWSIYEYGVQLSRSMDRSSLPELLRESLHQLPDSMAVSLLDGVLDHTTIPSLQEVLLNVLPMGREVSTAGSIVRMLVERCRVPRQELIKLLIEGMKHAKDPHSQNNYAYAIFTILGHGTSGWGAVLGDMREAEKVRHGLVEIAKRDLTKYARETLDECIARI